MKTNLAQELLERHTVAINVAVEDGSCFMVSEQDALDAIRAALSHATSIDVQVGLPPLPPVDGYDKRIQGHYSAQQMHDYARAALAATGKQQVGGAQGDAPFDVTDPWRGLYLPASMPAPSEYGDLTHPDIPLWPDEREDALDKLVHAQGFDFHIVAGDFTEAALEDGGDLYWQEMRAWNPEAPEGEWRLAWKGDTEDGPYAWFVRPMALRPDTAAPPAQGIDLGQFREAVEAQHAALMSSWCGDPETKAAADQQRDRLLALIDGRDAGTEAGGVAIKHEGDWLATAAALADAMSRSATLSTVQPPRDLRTKLGDA